MDLEAITQRAYDLFGTKQTHAHRERGHSFYHGQRVAKLALQLRTTLIPDDDSRDDILFVGALFHDAEKGNEPHNETGAVFVQQALQDLCSPNDLAGIADVVRLHNRRGTRADAMIQLVQDADVLDHEGTLHVWLMCVVTAAIGDSVPQAVAFWEQHLEHDTAEPRLNYDVSRAIFRERRQYFNSVVQRLRHEANGHIIGLVGNQVMPVANSVLATDDKPRAQ